MWKLEHQPRFDLDLDELQIFDELTYNHSINTALLATLIAIQLGHNEEFVHNVAIGALFHDWGKMLLPREILNKPSGLTFKEFEIVKKHPIYGEGMLRQKKVSEDVLKIIRQHHERWGGQGYPDSLCKEQIQRSAQIVAVADVFEALTADRPYRKGLHPYYALEMILSGEGTEFAPEVVMAFRKILQVYPENSIVVLNTGEIGEVMAVPVKLPTRPLVRLLVDRKGNRVEKQRVIDLAHELTYSVSSIEYHNSAESSEWARLNKR
jgi:putative nucleotidyltransferase with HDIG domain